MNFVARKCTVQQYKNVKLYLNIKTRFCPHNLHCMEFLYFSNLTSYIQPDDGYLCTAEICNCFYMQDKSCL